MIYITGDTHADFLRFELEKFPIQTDMTKDDYVIICGDFGGVWNYIVESKYEKYWLDWLNNKNFTTVFVDGNHENFERLYRYPVEEWNGGKVHKIRDSVLHLMRGEIFDIDNKKFFAFGGARSHDIQEGILNLDEEKYKGKGTSKEKRFRQFLIIEENSRVILLLEEIVDYGIRRNLLLKTYVPKINKIIKELKKYEKTIEIKESTIKNKKEEEILLKEIKEKISKFQYEFAIDRLHTLLKYKYEAIFKSINREIKGETLDAISGELNNILRINNVFKEKTTFSILSATKK